MNALSRLRGWFRRERVDATETWQELRDRADAEMTRKEAELQETPEQRLQRMEDEVRQNDEDFDELRRRIGGSGGSGGASTPSHAAEPDRHDGPERKA